MRLRANAKCEKPGYNRFLFLQPSSLQFCPSLFLSRNAGREGRETLVCVCRRCVTERVGDQSWTEHIPSREEKTKRCTKLDKNVLQRYVKAGQRRNKTATENCLLSRGLLSVIVFYFAGHFRIVYVICQVSIQL